MPLRAGGMGEKKTLRMVAQYGDACNLFAGTGEATVAWSAMLLLADAQRVCAAFEAAAWGLEGVEAFDAVA
jgi:hypothetical protein